MKKPDLTDSNIDLEGATEEAGSILGDESLKVFATVEYINAAICTTIRKSCELRHCIPDLERLTCDSRRLKGLVYVKLTNPK